MDNHTIILMQPTESPGSRTFTDHPTTIGAVEGVCEMFERKVKELNPNIQSITYDVSDLYGYIDKMADVSALVYDPKLNAYVPCNRDWLKKKCFLHFQRLATEKRK